jgi:hypothetical protein
MLRASTQAFIVAVDLGDEGRCEAQGQGPSSVSVDLRVGSGTCQPAFPQGPILPTGPQWRLTLHAHCSLDAPLTCRSRRQTASQCQARRKASPCSPWRSAGRWAQSIDRRVQSCSCCWTWARDRPQGSAVECVCYLELDVHALAVEPRPKPVSKGLLAICYARDGVDCGLRVNAAGLSTIRQPGACLSFSPARPWQASSHLTATPPLQQISPSFKSSQQLLPSSPIMIDRGSANNPASSGHQAPQSQPRTESA